MFDACSQVLAVSGCPSQTTCLAKIIEMKAQRGTEKVRFIPAFQNQTLIQLHACMLLQLL